MLNRWRMTAFILLGVIYYMPYAVVATPSTIHTTNQQTKTNTVTLLLPGMTCAVCPITVKKALNNVNGVEHVVVDFKAKSATVMYNPQKVTGTELMQATKDVGYPSTIKEEKFIKQTKGTQ